eukprot:scaffold97918_cov63-Phaeocystis_antarctica.AAC.3
MASSACADSTRGRRPARGASTCLGRAATGREDSPRPPAPLRGAPAPAVAPARPPRCPRAAGPAPCLPDRWLGRRPTAASAPPRRSGCPAPAGPRVRRPCAVRLPSSFQGRSLRRRPAAAAPPPHGPWPPP